MGCRKLEKSWKLYSNLLFYRNATVVKQEHPFYFKHLHQLPNQDLTNPVTDTTFPLINSSKTTGRNDPGYMSCIHKPLAINLQSTCSDKGFRKYLSKYPSVTSILSDTKTNKEFYSLKNWEKANIEKIGRKKFADMQKTISERGKSFHEEMKFFFSNLNVSNLEEKIENSGYFQSVHYILPDVVNPVAIESSMVHSHLEYGGTVDLVAEYKGKLSILDWKTSEKKKAKLRDCHAYPVQVAAYAGAINYDDDYPFQISRGVLVIAYENGDPADVHILDENVLQDYWDEWLLRLKKYKKASNDKALEHVSITATLENTSSAFNDSNENGTMECLSKTDEEHNSASYLGPSTLRARDRELLTANVLNGGLRCVQNRGKKLNEIGQMVKDEDIVPSWRSLPWLMESAFGKGFLSKGHLYFHYIKSIFKEMLFFDKMKKK